MELDAIPGACDGLVLGLHGSRRRPLILLDANQSEVRRRFTAAHEIGHVLLPWHVASDFLCDTSRTTGLDVEARYAESEANRFAAELLVPSRWLADLGQRLGSGPTSLTERTVHGAQVSPHVACICLTTYLPVGHVFAIIDSLGGVVLSGQTPGTRIGAPDVGSPLDRRRLDRFALDVSETSFGSSQVVWWTFGGPVSDHAPNPDDARSLRALEDALLARHAPNAATAKAVRQSLSGVVGAAFGDAKRASDVTAESLYVRLRSRFAKIRERVPETMLEDPDFDEWLRRRVRDLAERARTP